MPPSEWMNTNDVVFVLKYLLRGIQPPSKNIDSNFTKNNEQDEKCAKRSKYPFP